jgi:hypothetical protein
MHKDFQEGVDAAVDVLDTNWTGRYTVPATGLYPHQWSWDSAFIAIGTRHREPGRARAELVALLDAQWSDGRVPQIVYDVGRDDDYAPGAEFWRSPTSGLVQPPVHAWAAWLVHCADPAGSAREGFLARVYPRLARWHEYLHGRRAGAVGLPVTKHPWETGTDNSPLWDAALERVPPEARTAIRRPDLRHAGTGERPGSRDYRRYYRLAEAYRDAGCADDVPIGFAMVCPLFTSVLAVSELALARMAAALSDDGGRTGDGRGGGRPDDGSLPGGERRATSDCASGAHETTAARILAAMDKHLWDEDLGLFVALDDITGSCVRRATANGLVPLLLATGPTALAGTRTERMLATLADPGFLGGGRYLPSTSRQDPAFDPALYWRGPAWFNISWLLLRAVQVLGRSDLATHLREHFAVAAPEEFPEYVDPDTGTGRGTRRFSWTAALTLDVLLADESGVLPAV